MKQPIIAPIGIMYQFHVLRGILQNFKPLTFVRFQHIVKTQNLEK